MSNSTEKSIALISTLSRKGQVERWTFILTLMGSHPPTPAHQGCQNGQLESADFQASGQWKETRTPENEHMEKKKFSAAK